MCCRRKDTSTSLFERSIRAGFIHYLIHIIHNKQYVFCTCFDRVCSLKNDNAFITNIIIQKFNNWVYLNNFTAGSDGKRLKLENKTGRRLAACLH